MKCVSQDGKNTKHEGFHLMPVLSMKSKMDGSLLLLDAERERCKRTHDTTAPIVTDVLRKEANLDLRRDVWRFGSFAGD